MNRQEQKGLLKHLDFIVLDLLVMQLCFVASYWATVAYRNPYRRYLYRYQAMVLLGSQLAVILFGGGYKNIIRRKRLDELFSAVKYMAEILVVALVYLFAVHESHAVSRLQFGVTSALFIPAAWAVRCLNKMRILHSGSDGISGGKKSITLVTSRALLKEALEKLTGRDIYRDYFLSGIILMDSGETGAAEVQGIPVHPLNAATVEGLSHGWTDEVFILQPDDMPFPTEFMNDLMEMGITVHYSMSALNSTEWAVTNVQKLGGYRVLTSSIRFASAGQLALKRMLDILGGLVGCAVTGVLFIFVAPAIYIKSPGPVFFAQDRVGKNGKVFRMYKFRSMYLDAEARKAALMEQNKMSGMMFKVDDDPRIIGSEKKDKNGKPKGIGNFIRNTSIDEFPQFFNVLSGSMSLVGTRPPTLDEWKQYELHHRVRMSTKPGITGMWQVSGRNEITDFEEVVRLDREYIENWSIGLDIKLLLKTVWVVVMRRGAE